jgi:hypothetical protein
MPSIFDDEWFLNDLRSAQRYAWYKAKYYVKFARSFNDVYFQKFYIKQAMWHRSHAKQIRNVLNGALLRLNKQ